MPNKKSIFKVGTVINSLIDPIEGVEIKFYSLTVKCPYRLNAMALDPSLIAFNDEHIYSPGEIIFPIQLFRTVQVSCIDGNEIVVNQECQRKQLVVHSAELIRKALRVNQGFKITVTEDLEMKHTGFGSSSGLMAAVAIAINELYGNPITSTSLITYLAQNHGEEIDGDSNHLEHIQCIGGSAAACLIKAGMIILAGQSKVIASMKLGENLDVVIGIPKNYKPKDAHILAQEELMNMDKFVATGKKFGKDIAYSLIHQTLPAMSENNLRLASEIIYKYRFEYGSIQNCSFVFPPMNEIAESVKHLQQEPQTMTLSLSSVGPAFFAITTDSKKCVTVFEQAGMDCILTKIHNNGYQIIEKIKL